ncbi:RING finger and CHY zinc finger domain-containing protein [Aspergillus undulatus]|uniref:RING finger and CHY zinc finger domain-containing protein n=1 Tax=Aspergillus undulatus TaxID=1810928 RepID=UPI003CCCD072
MSGIFQSFLSKPVIQKALRLPQQSNPRPVLNDDPPQPESQGIGYLGDYICSNGVGRSSMSGLNQEIHTDEHSESIEFTGAGNGTLTASSPPIDSTASSSQSSGGCDSDITGRHGDHTSSQNANSIGDTSFGDPSATPRQARHDPQINLDDTEGTRESPNQNMELDEIGGRSLLPEDDGMGALRRRIHAIRDLGYTSHEQARMIHDLMTEKYASSQAFSGNHLSPISSPTPSFRTPEQADTPNRWSGQSFDHPSFSPVSTATSALQDVIHNLTPEDLKPTFYPRVETELPAEDAEDADAEELDGPCLGCPHYKRNVKLQCFDCKKWYTCRFCHDEVEDHHLDRPKTENMLCMICGHAQPAAQYCTRCGELAAQYYCVACKLWDNDASKSIYHCNDCGICRIGKGIGKDFFHCKTCSVCLPVSIETTHRCIERSTQCDCPICGDYMFTSPETVVFMRCGHSIHQRCLSEYSKSSYRCPICSKTIRNMEATFRNLDRAIESQPMPVDFKDTKAIITCNDCGTKSVVKYHWLGLRCDMCESYNTTQLSVLQGDELDHSEPNFAGESVPASRLRSSSHGGDDSVLPSLAPLQIDPSSAPGAGAHPQFNLSRSNNPSERFHSYNLTRGRAVSPVISNYFGIPPDRQSQSSTSASFFGSRLNQSDENDGEGELNIWGTRFKYRYGFLSRVTDLADDDEEEELSDSSNSEKEDDEDDDDDDEEGIDIFGHR